MRVRVQDYCRWTLSSVINAFQRFKDIKERHLAASLASGGDELDASNHALLLTRREFWEYATGDTLTRAVTAHHCADTPLTHGLVQRRVCFARCATGRSRTTAVS